MERIVINQTINIHIAPASDDAIDTQSRELFIDEVCKIARDAFEKACIEVHNEWVGNGFISRTPDE